MLFSGKNSYEGLKQIEKAYGNDKKGFKRFLDWLKRFIAKFKDAFNIRHPIKSSTTASSIMKLEKNIVELQKEIDEGKTVDNDGEVRYNKSKYNEFNTLAMQWAYSASTKTGDTKVLNRNGKEFVLLEATDDGYVELYSGTYEGAKALEKTYRRTDEKIYEYIEGFETDKDGNSLYSIGTNDTTNAVGMLEDVRGKEIQNNSSRNAKHLQSSDKKIQSSEAGLENSAFSIGEEIYIEYVLYTIKWFRNYQFIAQTSSACTSCCQVALPFWQFSHNTHSLFVAFSATGSAPNAPSRDGPSLQVRVLSYNN